MQREIDAVEGLALAIRKSGGKGRQLANSSLKHIDIIHCRGRRYRISDCNEGFFHKIITEFLHFPF